MPGHDGGRECQNSIGCAPSNFSYGGMAHGHGGGDGLCDRGPRNSIIGLFAEVLDQGDLRSACVRMYFFLFIVLTR